MIRNLRVCSLGLAVPPIFQVNKNFWCLGMLMHRNEFNGIIFDRLWRRIPRIEFFAKGIQSLKMICARRRRKIFCKPSLAQKGVDRMSRIWQNIVILSEFDLKKVQRQLASLLRNFQVERILWLKFARCLLSKLHEDCQTLIIFNPSSCIFSADFTLANFYGNPEFQA